jgi:hypothetical protein
MTDFFRLQLGVVSRAEGHCAAKRSAYQACGTIIDHEGQRFDFSRKAAEHVATIMLVPNGSPDWARSSESLWQRAAAVEKRVDAQEARIVDFSMPRAVPAELWDACIRHVYAPFVESGMVFQIDIHDTAASDGGRNVNVHGLATLREIDGDGFAACKNRTWNNRFRERGGRAVREQFAERLTAFCQSHGIEYVGDARPNSERDRPAPEPELPRWNFEAWKREGEMTEALEALHQHRVRRRAWEAAQAEAVEATLDLARIDTRMRERRQRRLAPAGPADARADKPDRRAAVLRAWHGTRGWIDADTVAAIKSTRFDEVWSCLWIALQDGSTLIDRGDVISLRGRLTWTAAMETAAAAERHGWNEVTVSGDEMYKDAVAVACLLRGIGVTNHTLSPKAQMELDRLRGQRSRKSNEAGNILADDPERLSNPALGSPSSAEIHRQITKRRCVEMLLREETPATDGQPSVYIPRFAPLKTKKPDHATI